MKEILITSSVLILALLALRRLFRQKISRRAQYALWALVLVRLLVPVSLPAADFSVLTAAAPVMEELEGPALYIRPTQERISPVEGDSGRRVTASSQGFAAMGPATGDNTRTFTDENWVTHQIEYDRQIGLAGILQPVWLGGIAVMACWMAVSNLRFWRKLRRSRIPLELEGCRYPVYLVEEGLPSPCLFGLFRPAIYLTPAAMASPDSLRHVLAHESTHARHLDPLWSLLRGVCLAVYWFDPLVWWAAGAARVDCELACDEGAIRQLGEDHRLAYGQTLLRLIPVRRRGGGSLLTATTMVSDKKRLADRIARIAENRKTRWTALAAAAVLALAVCAVTFTGSAGAKRPLTADELAWFNESFFAGDPSTSVPQRLLGSSYNSPEQIDLWRTFYYGDGLSGGVSGEEEAILDQKGLRTGRESLPYVKLTPAAMDAALEQYTGMGLEDTEGRGLDEYTTYLLEYDAYYFTSYMDDRTPIQGQVMQAGEREGNLVRLYYTLYSDPYGWWYCVTLEDRGNDEYWFVSNGACRDGIPAIPTNYPDSPSLEMIPLDRVMPYAPPETETVRLEPGQLVYSLGGGSAMEDWRAGLFSAADGCTYLAVLDEYAELDLRSTGATAYARLPDEGAVRMETFYGLFGHEGVAVTYSGWLEDGSYSTQFKDYYAVDEENTLTLLLRTYGTALPVDLDGDGSYELASSDNYRQAQIFYQRSGQLYMADLGQLLPDYWPEAGYLEFGSWSAERCLSLWGGVVIPGQEDRSTGEATAFRDLYFDGESLLVYKSVRAPAMDLPTYVNEAASALAQDRMSWWQQNTGAVSGDGTPFGEQAEWDSWRLHQVEKVDSARLGDLPGGLEVEVYDFAYELHTTTPEKVALAGGMYLDEDGWVGGFYEEDRFLVFWKNPATGQFERLESHISSDLDVDSKMFRAGLLWTLVRGGALELGALSAEDLLLKLQDAPMDVLSDLASYSDAERDAALTKLLTHPDAAAYLSEMRSWDEAWFPTAALETWELLREMPLG